jgi:acyl carrier protein
MEASKIEAIIYEVFDQLMDQSENLTLEKSPTCPLTGDGSALDSLGLVNFLVALEQKLQAETSSDLNIANQDLIIGKDQPLRTVETLVAHLAAKLD